MKTFHPMASLGLALAVLLQSGYATAPAQATEQNTASYARVKGELKATENASLDRVWQATLDAVEELKCGTTRQGRTSQAAEIAIVTPRGTPVEIRFKARSEERTEVRIRVGPHGDEARARVILGHIQKRL